MRVRRPALDFSETPAHWAEIPEFAQMYNASSLWIPHLERFLNRVLAKALTHLKERGKLTEKLREDMQTFIRQESNHYSMHESFNAILPRNGYDVAHFEKLFEQEFDKLLRNYPIEFLTAYCEGFETLGPPSAINWLDNSEDLLVGARPEVVGLWKWHLLEEYEHRHVCHDVFHAVHGGYAMRIRGFLFQLKQLGGFSNMVKAYLLEVDRARMTPAERAESLRQEEAMTKRFKGAMLPRLAKVFSPFYTPYNAPEPAHYRAYMAQVEAALA